MATTKLCSSGKCNRGVKSALKIVATDKFYCPDCGSRFTEHKKITKKKQVHTKNDLTRN